MAHYPFNKSTPMAIQSQMEDCRWLWEGMKCQQMALIFYSLMNHCGAGTILEINDLTERRIYLVDAHAMKQYLLWHYVSSMNPISDRKRVVMLYLTQMTSEFLRKFGSQDSKSRKKGEDLIEKQDARFTQWTEISTMMCYGTRLRILKYSNQNTTGRHIHHLLSSRNVNFHPKIRGIGEGHTKTETRHAICAVSVPSTFATEFSRDFRLFCTIWSCSSRSMILL